jgi:predicted transcriptional regulator
VTFELIGPLQARVMDFAWSQPHGVSVSEAHCAVNSVKRPALAYTTILTVMRNLSRRGILAQVKDDGSPRHIFTPTITREAYRAQLAQYIVETYYGGEFAAFVIAFDTKGEGHDLKKATA